MTEVYCVEGRMFFFGSKKLTQTPTIYVLHEAYPNPFNPTTKIKFEIPFDGLVSLKIYNALGQEIATVVNEGRTAGRYEATFDAATLPSGVYVYRLIAGNFTASKRMILIK